MQHDDTDYCGRDSEGSVLTVTKILEPQDRHIISTGAYTVASTSGFSSTSVHLFDAREILRRYVSWTVTVYSS